MKLDAALADALGRVIAELSNEWKKELGRIDAESRALLAEAKAENLALREQLRAQHAHALDKTKDIIPSLIAEEVGKLPPPAPGKDGLGFDDLSVDYDGERTLTLRFARGDERKEFSLTLPIVLDRGIYDSSRAYAKGDGVTDAGSFWIAQRETNSKPGTDDSWRLSVKRGRDGRAAVKLSSE